MAKTLIGNHTQTYGQTFGFPLNTQKPWTFITITHNLDMCEPSSPHSTQPSVATWWKTTEKYYHHLSNTKKTSPLSIPLNKQILDENYSLGKSLTSKHLIQLASKGDHKNWSEFNINNKTSKRAMLNPQEKTILEIQSSINSRNENKNRNTNGNRKWNCNWKWNAETNRN